MAGYQEIVGNKDAIMHLKNTVRSGKLAHAYLIDGIKGSGKKMLADAFAAALLCEKQGEEACGACHHCHQSAAGTNPDIKYVSHEKPAVISIDEIRHQIVNDAAVRPYYEGHKVYILEDAHLMTSAAQNALLKTLEEPPEYVVIMLLTDRADSLLETIRSRCIRLSLPPLPSDQVERYLMHHLSIPDYQAKECAAFAQGSIGRAMELASSEDFYNIRQTALNLVHKADTLEMSELMDIVKQVSKYGVMIQDFLDFIAVWYRDVLYFKATREADSLIFRGDLQQIRTRASKSSYEGIETILKALDKAESRLNANVSQDLTMELLFLTIREN